MTNLFWNTVTEDMRSVLSGFTQNGLGQRFYLAGGTALSLQIGHRLSVDLDFFSQTEDIPSVRRELEKALEPYQAVLADSSWSNLLYVVNDTRIGFYGYGYALVAPLVEREYVRLASVEDIALMKLDAILSRASRKDFYDLYYICQSTPLSQIFQKAPQKYPSVRDFEVQATKRLTFFENAENETDPVLLHNVSWNTVKDFFIQQAKDIERNWLQ
jgi:predicted nucleotidyltransferase component of viral defense system